MPKADMSMGTPPKLLMASTMSVLPWLLTMPAMASRGVEHAGGCLAMDDCHVRHVGVCVEIVTDGLRIDWLCLLELHHMAAEAVIVGDDAHALPVGAVGGYEQTVARMYGSAKRGLHAERPASLHEYGRIFLRAGGGQLG